MARPRNIENSQALTTAQQLETISRPDAPYDLNDEEAKEWWAVVNRLPAAWFQRETHALLSQYCRHIVRARRIAELIHAAEKDKNFDPIAYCKLLQAEEVQSRAICSLATKMRISQQSSLDERKRKPMTMRRPWED